ncbi:tripartite tricarboxylate transporter substrate binding protein [Roseococcus sp. SDR]|uniref:tripartite tricarboxylate transporter substrate binding protein n=1 Tax=Roseococcus sp. SDR TaxID=2835532 RepID=UPI001BCF0C70|nr:tripartite tricarboxylate transporter substrate binding protein [Roseococcus sp. SDR]MBS7790355.1 tripartite tricarboxylate transporter substrate binding protein [Roseococcus sp. SDR]MBV1845669.1 tripartite tricarboxylate transporter substrate binding protein [Roseococcus sp. SDR]
MIRRRHLALGAAALPLAAPLLAARAQVADWPNRPIRLVSPFPPGGAADLTARLMAEELTGVLRHSVVVENRTGVGGAVGSEFVARSTPDGYTWLLASTGPFAITPELVRLNFDPARDLAPVAMVSIVPSVFVVNPAVPANNMAELIALARARPGQLSYASGGNGTAQHLFGEMLKQMAGLDIQHVPYRGGGPALTDTIAGRVQILCDTLPLSLPHIREGRVRAVGVTTAQRHPALPDVPTVAESGVPGYEAVGWYGMAAPVGTPEVLIARMNREVNALLDKPLLRERMAAQGSDPLAMTPAAFQARIAEDRARWARVIRDGNIRPD